METDNLKSEDILELIFSIEAKESEDDVIKALLPASLRKLNCFMAGVLKEDNSQLIEKLLLPFVFNKDNAWKQIKDYILKTRNKANKGFCELVYDDKYYYVYCLADYGYIVLGRKKQFENIFKNEFRSVVSFIGKVLSQSIANEYRRVAEQKLVEERRLLRTIIDNVPVSIYTKDFQFRKTLANTSEIKRIGALSEADVLGKTDFELFPESFANLSLIEDKQVLYDGIPILGKEKHYDNDCWALSSKLPLKNDDGQVTGIVGISVDFTGQKKLEKELERALALAENAAKAKEMFLANMSHEIRTPLNVITGMVRELGKEDLNDKQRSYVKHSETAAEHLLTIINNILDMSKIESGEFELDNKDFSVSAVVGNVRSILFSKAREKNLELRIDLSTNIEKALLGDAGRLRQVLINLLGNSIKFTEKGFVNLAIEVLKTNKLNQQLRFTVSDSGIGMSNEFMKRLFDKFTQEEGSSNRRFEGTGLGMSITKELIQLMGGEIEVSSIKGEGTQISFSIQFPVGDASKLVDNSKIIDKNAFEGMKILLVEDNEMNRFIAIQSLKHLGCEITEAENGLEAIEKIQQTDFDLILMDIQMPLMDGVEATKQIRCKFNADIPIIALTANAFKHDIDLYLSVGMNNYLIKPYKEKELLEKIGMYANKNKHSKGSISDNKANDTLFDLSQLRELSRGDEEFVRKMLVAFKQIANQSVEQLNEAIDNNDIDSIRKIAHKIKPSVDNMQITSALGKVKLLEKFDFEINSDSELKILVEDVTKILRRVVEDIELIYLM